MTPDWDHSDIDKWNRKWQKRACTDSVNIGAIVFIILLFITVNLLAC